MAPNQSNFAQRKARAGSSETPDPGAEAAHQDIGELTGAVRDLARALKPLEALATHVPALVEMAQVWNAGKNGGRAAWRFGTVTGAAAKWISSIALAVAITWLVIHARWETILKALIP